MTIYTPKFTGDVISAADCQEIRSSYHGSLAQTDCLDAIDRHANTHGRAGWVCLKFTDHNLSENRVAEMKAIRAAGGKLLVQTKGKGHKGLDMDLLLNLMTRLRRRDVWPDAVLYGNEPMMKGQDERGLDPVYWGLQTSQWLHKMASAAPDIKRVIGGVGAWPRAAFLADYLDPGALELVDVVGVHHYGARPSLFREFDWITRIQMSFKNSGSPMIPEVWMTEGAHSFPKFDKGGAPISPRYEEKAMACFELAMYLEGMATGVPQMRFNLKDDWDAPGCGIYGKNDLDAYPEMLLAHELLAAPKGNMLVTQVTENSLHIGVFDDGLAIAVNAPTDPEDTSNIWSSYAKGGGFWLPSSEALELERIAVHNAAGVDLYQTKEVRVGASTTLVKTMGGATKTGSALYLPANSAALLRWN